MMHPLATRAEVAPKEPFIFYHYEVSMIAAIVSVVLFGLATMVHVVQILRTRIWFTLPFAVGTGFEVAGYVGRILNALEHPGPYTLIPYIIQSIFLLFAPALLAASIYMELGRIVTMVRGEEHLLIHRARLTKTFVVGDIIAFVLQATGGSLQASKKAATARFSKKILLIGLCAQLVFSMIFVLIAGLFQSSFELRPTKEHATRPWRKHLHSLYTVSILIFARTLVHLVEHNQGNDGYIISHEPFLYAFDASVIFLAVSVMSWIHPGEIAKQLRDDEVGDEESKDQTIWLDNMSV